MTCICLDCYLAVVHPITYRVRKGLTSRVLMSAAVWVVTVMHSVWYIVIDYHDSSILNILAYVITIPVIVVCDVFIFRALKRPDPAGRDIHPQKQKALQIITNSLIMALLSYLLPVLVYISGKLAPIELNVFVCSVLFPSYICPTMGSAIMPILYLSNLGKLNWSWFSVCKSS